jgi:8-oxo-dGTP pyrophosphatase MutT (NUDIX family)
MRKDGSANPWTMLGTTCLHEGRYLAYHEDRVRHSSGREHSHMAIRVRERGVAIAPIDTEGQTYLVGQYRYAHGQFTWELPRGSAPATADPLAAAERELAEETGFRAARWLEMLRLAPAPGISDETVPCYVAWGLTAGAPSPDETETLSLRALRFDAAVAAALSGEICDGLSVALLLGLRERVRRCDLPEDLLDALRRGS